MNVSRMPAFSGHVSIRAKKESQVSILRDAIANTCGGPLTPFILISRAARLASDRRAFNSDDVATALHEELLSRGWLIDEEDA